MVSTLVLLFAAGSFQGFTANGDSNELTFRLHPNSNQPDDALLKRLFGFGNENGTESTEGDLTTCINTTESFMSSIFDKVLGRSRPLCKEILSKVKDLPLCNPGEDPGQRLFFPNFFGDLFKQKKPKCRLPNDLVTIGLQNKEITEVAPVFHGRNSGGIENTRESMVESSVMEMGTTMSYKLKKYWSIAIPTISSPELLSKVIEDPSTLDLKEVSIGTSPFFLDQPEDLNQKVANRNLDSQKMSKHQQRGWVADMFDKIVGNTSNSSTPDYIADSTTREAISDYTIITTTSAPPTAPPPRRVETTQPQCQVGILKKLLKYLAGNIPSFIDFLLLRQASKFANQPC